MRRLPLLAMSFAILLAACTSGPDGTRAPSTAPTGAAAPTSPGAPPGATPRESAGETGLVSDPLHAIELLDVRDGSMLTIGALAADRPVLLETMAIWCTNCRMQQDQVKAAHGSAEFTSISLDVDPTELPGDLKEYAAQHAYDWHFSKATAALAQQLRERFGTSVLNPPSTPKILFRPDGSVTALDFNRIYSADDLAALVNAG